MVNERASGESLFFVFWRVPLSLPTFHSPSFKSFSSSPSSSLSESTKHLKTLSIIAHLLIGECFNLVMHLQSLEGNHLRIPLLYAIPSSSCNCTNTTCLLNSILEITHVALCHLMENTSEKRSSTKRGPESVLFETSDILHWVSRSTCRVHEGEAVGRAQKEFLIA